MEEWITAEQMSLKHYLVGEGGLLDTVTPRVPKNTMVELRVVFLGPDGALAVESQVTHHPETPGDVLLDLLSAGLEVPEIASGEPEEPPPLEEVVLPPEEPALPHEVEFGG